MNITLRAGERLFINGAVIRIDRKASIELLNEVTFLLENHVMQAEEAATLVRQIYFAVQIMLMDPTAAGSAAPLARSLIQSALGAYLAPDLTAGLESVAASLVRGRSFEALKTLRGLFVLEDKELQPRPRRRAPREKENTMTVSAASPVVAPPCRIRPLHLHPRPRRPKA